MFIPPEARPGVDGKAEPSPVFVGAKEGAGIDPVAMANEGGIEVGLVTPDVESYLMVKVELKDS